MCVWYRVSVDIAGDETEQVFWLPTARCGRVHGISARWSSRGLFIHRLILVNGFG